jgi:hypothetical protein
MNQKDREYILRAVNQYKTKIHPGFPVANFPMSVKDTLTSLIELGELELIQVTKNKPTGIVTYRYVKQTGQGR